MASDVPSSIRRRIGIGKRGATLARPGAASAGDRLRGRCRLDRHGNLIGGQHHELPVHHRQVRGNAAREIVDAGCFRDVGRVDSRLWWELDEEVAQDERMVVVFGIQEREAKRVARDRRDRARLIFVDLFPREHAASRYIPFENRLSLYHLLYEERHGGDRDRSGARNVGARVAR
jgi:hypothetical protein